MTILEGNLPHFDELEVPLGKPSHLMSLTEGLVCLQHEQHQKNTPKQKGMHHAPCTMHHQSETNVAQVEGVFAEVLNMDITVEARGWSQIS